MNILHQHSSKKTAYWHFPDDEAISWSLHHMVSSSSQDVRTAMSLRRRSEFHRHVSFETRGKYWSRRDPKRYFIQSRSWTQNTDFSVRRTSEEVEMEQEWDDDWDDRDF